VKGAHAWALAVTLLVCTNVYTLCVIFQPDIQAASDRICVPLYAETGFECCQ
jgi:hypothetical protein